MVFSGLGADIVMDHYTHGLDYLRVLHALRHEDIRFSVNCHGHGVANSRFDSPWRCSLPNDAVSIPCKEPLWNAEATRGSGARNDGTRQDSRLVSPDSRPSIRTGSYTFVQHSYSKRTANRYESREGGPRWCTSAFSLK